MSQEEHESVESGQVADASVHYPNDFMHLHHHHNPHLSSQASQQQYHMVQQQQHSENVLLLGDDGLDAVSAAGLLSMPAYMNQLAASSQHQHHHHLHHPSSAHLSAPHMTTSTSTGSSPSASSPVSPSLSAPSSASAAAPGVSSLSSSSASSGPNAATSPSMLLSQPSQHPHLSHAHLSHHMSHAHAHAHPHAHPHLSDTLLPNGSALSAPGSTGNVMLDAAAVPVDLASFVPAIGQTFSNFNEIENLLDAFARANSFVIIIMRSQRPGGHVVQATFGCYKSGSYRPNKVDTPNKRTIKTNCPFQINVRYSEKTSEYRITKVDLEHNHELDFNDIKMASVKRTSKRKPSLGTEGLVDLSGSLEASLADLQPLLDEHGEPIQGAGGILSGANAATAAAVAAAQGLLVKTPSKKSRKQRPSGGSGAGGHMKGNNAAAAGGGLGMMSGVHMVGGSGSNTSTPLLKSSQALLGDASGSLMGSSASGSLDALPSSSSMGSSASASSSSSASSSASSSSSLAHLQQHAANDLSSAAVSHLAMMEHAHHHHHGLLHPDVMMHSHHALYSHHHHAALLGHDDPHHSHHHHHHPHHHHHVEDGVHHGGADADHANEFDILSGLELPADIADEVNEAMRYNRAESTPGHH